MIKLNFYYLKLIIVCIFFIPLFALGKVISQSYAFKDYDEAYESPIFLKFDMESTKLGLITTDFTGFVKNFSVTGDVQKNIAKKITLSFLIKNMDTDSDGRNEKMWEYCLDFKNHPEIILNSKNPITLNEGQQTVPLWINLRGKKFPIDMDIKLKKEANQILATGNAKAFISKLEIPDPSIAIAEVNDLIKISFHFPIKYEK